MSYRASRFFRRHRVAGVAGALAILTAVVGAAVSLYEAHRAQQRFAQVRDLSNRFIFDFEAAIRDTPGTLAARRMVASTARIYLAQLAQDAGRDPNLRRELAESYSRLARVEMSAGENPANIEHLKKSIDLRKSLKDDCCGSPSARAQYIGLLTDLARANDDAGSPEEARKLAADAAINARTWYAQSPDEPLAAKAMVMALSTEGNVLMGRGKTREGHADLEQATRLSEQLMLRNPNDDDTAYDRARAGNWLASSLAILGDTAAARVEEDHAKAVMDGLLERHPDNFRWRNLRVRMAASTASFLRTLADSDPSLHPLIIPAAREAYEMARENSRRNPGDKDLLDTAVVMTSRLANQTAREHHEAEAIPLFDEAKSMIEDLVKADPRERNLYLLAANRTAVGRMLMNLKRWPEAVPVLSDAEKSIGQVLARRPSESGALGVKATVLMNQAMTERHLGDLNAARERCTLAMRTAAELIAKNKDAKNPWEDLDELRQEAHLLHVADITAVPH